MCQAVMQRARVTAETDIGICPAVKSHMCANDTNSSLPMNVKLNHIGAVHGRHWLALPLNDHSPDVCLCMQVVDQIMLSSFEELDDASVNSDPLVVLGCGHAFVTSSLDEYMGMREVYTEGQEGAWVAAKQLPDDVALQGLKTCPAGGCKKPVVGVRRYGRAVNRAMMALIDRKHADTCRWVRLS